MYEVASAAAYTPQAWTPPRPPRHESVYSPASRTPSPTKRYTPRRSISNLQDIDLSSPPVPLPRIPHPQPTRYKNNPSRSPDRNRRSMARPVDYNTRTSTMDSSESRWAPLGGGTDYTNYDSSPTRPSMHRAQDSQDTSAPLMPNAAHRRDRVTVSPPRGNRFDRGYVDNGYVSPPPPPPNHFRAEPVFDDINPHEIDDDESYEEPLHHAERVSRTPLAGAGASSGMPGGFASRRPYAPPPEADRFQHEEKDAWRQEEERARSGRKKKILIIVGVLVLLLVIGATIGGVLGSKASKNSPSSPNASPSNSGLTLDSSEIRSLMNNANLHRVFPALDYTGINMQYPDCLTDRPSQDNVTMDVAVMSQLAPAIRLYGTDCNQTEMVMTAIDALKMNDTMKVWLGVWLGNNATTNNRQLAQLYDILHNYPSSHFSGVIVGNEVLFRKDLTLAELGSTIRGVKQNLTALNIDLPVATSDLGSDWTKELVQYTDLVMANVHPFFAGVTAAGAASWTYDFWQTNDVTLTGNVSNNIISEVGWPSQGGNDCGTGVTCPTMLAGSVAGIQEMNTFMDKWICQAMANGTHYFWFEAFDEPWKIIYDTPTDGWEE
ncbi:hypothetical protein MBLNU457_1523t1 [Dothideomycetes sp. NU457]